MSTINISSGTPFGSMSSVAVSQILAIDLIMRRLNAAVANAASGYSGTAGTEYEATSGNATPNLFGVVPSATPGAQGNAWAFAMNNLCTQWNSFMTAAQPYLNALDVGSR